MIRIRTLVTTLLASMASAVATPAAAAVITFGASLAGSGEVPPNASPGTGHGSVTVDTVLHTFLVDIAFGGLLAPTTASHIHCCAPVGTNATVATQLPTFAGFPLGVTSGTYTQLFDMSLATSYNPAFVAANGGTPLAAFDALVNGMLGGLAYLNIHTTQFPGGEIRGQLAVPEPGTVALLAIAAIALVPLLRRRRRKFRASTDRR